jgi:hypothetical protein
MEIDWGATGVAAGVGNNRADDNDTDAGGAAACRCACL